jgi:hypothetical protein
MTFKQAKQKLMKMAKDMNANKELIAKVEARIEEIRNEMLQYEPEPFTPKMKRLKLPYPPRDQRELEGMVELIMCCPSRKKGKR